MLNLSVEAEQIDDNHKENLVLVLESYGKLNYELPTSGPTFFTIKTQNLIPEDSYNIYIYNLNLTKIISRENTTGLNLIQFIANNNHEMVIENLENRDSSINIEIYADLLDENEESGYQIESSNYRCWMNFSDSSGLTIIPINSLNAGKYSVMITIYDDKGKIGITLSSTHPDSDSNWRENGYFFTATTQTTREIDIQRNIRYMVISSIDLKAHIYTIYFSYIGVITGIPETVVIAIIVSAFIALVAVRANNKKRTIGTGYYNHKISQKETTEKLKLSAQVDWRFEGSRYAYVPPDVQDPNLTRPLDDKKNQ